MPYAAGLAAVVALAGCGDGGTQAGGPSTSGQAKTSTAVTSSASPTTTTEPVDPVLARIPAAARPETPAAGAAYVRFYFEQVNRAFTDADTTPIENLAAKDCEMCSAFAAGVEDLRSKGHHYERDLASIEAVSSMEFTRAGGRVLVDLKQMPVPIQDVHGKTVRTAATAEVRFVATVTYEGRWLITRLQNAK